MEQMLANATPEERLEAEKIWSMLESMSAKDPAKYNAFIKKTMADGERQMAPPEPRFYVETTLTKGAKVTPVFLNICAWNRVPAPANDDVPIPCAGGKFAEQSVKDCASLVTICCFNEKVLDKYGPGAGQREHTNMLIELALDFVDSVNKPQKLQRRFSLSPAKSKVIFMGEYEPVVEIVFPFFVPANPFERAAMETMKQKVKDTGAPVSLSPSSAKIEKEPPMDIKLPGVAGTTAKGRPLIEDLNPTPADTFVAPPKLGQSAEQLTNGSAADEPLIQQVKTTKLLPNISHQIVDRVTESGAREYVVTFSLPPRTSAAECDAEILTTKVTLAVGQLRHVVEFPSRILESSARAKFSGKKYTLTITARAG